VEQGVRASGKVAIGTVKGDVHYTGKNLVAMTLEGSCYEIMDLGVDVSTAQFVEAIRNGVNVVIISALLTTTMTNMEAAIDAVQAAGPRNQLKVLVGGAPITKTYAEEISVYGYAADASSAVRTLRSLLTAYCSTRPLGASTAHGPDDRPGRYPDVCLTVLGAGHYHGCLDDGHGPGADRVHVRATLYGPGHDGRGPSKGDGDENAKGRHHWLRVNCPGDAPAILARVE
jgi:methylmalonyl-CoA mutase cobalamin-binding subunit